MLDPYTAEKLIQLQKKDLEKRDRSGEFIKYGEPAPKANNLKGLLERLVRVQKKTANVGRR